MKNILGLILVSLILLLPGCGGYDYYPPSENPPPETSPLPSTPSVSPPEIPSPNPPLNVRIDYIGVKNAMGDDDYPKDLYGEIQLIIAISDGKNKPQEYYIPQPTPKGLEGFKIASYETREFNEPVYHTAFAGDYLRVSIIAYDRDSNTELLTDAEIVAALGTIAGVPEAKIFPKLVSLLPEDDELVGEYQQTWYPDQNYGIGPHQVSCKDKFGHDNFFVGFYIWSKEEPPLLPAPARLPGVPESQTLECTMPSNITLGSYVKFERPLRASEKVKGSARLTGDIPYMDWDSTCCFWIYDPSGNEIHEWCQDFKEGGLYQEFSFTTSYDGEYTIKVGHCSYYARELHIEVSPFGWVKSD